MNTSLFWGSLHQEYQGVREEKVKLQSLPKGLFPFAAMINMKCGEASSLGCRQQKKHPKVLSLDNPVSPAG